MVWSKFDLLNIYDILRKKVRGVPNSSPHYNKYMEIHCLMVSGIGLSGADRTLLFHTAHTMFRSNRNKHSVKTKSMEGTISTNWECAQLGSTTGIKFSAHLSTEKGSSVVEYIVRHCHLEEEELGQGFWGTIPDEIYRSLTKVTGLN